MQIRIEAHPYVHMRLTAEQLSMGYGANKFIRCGNKYIALACNELIYNNITHVTIVDRRKNPIYKQHMQLSMGRIPKQYVEDTHTYRVYNIDADSIYSHTYELYTIIG